MRAALLLVLAGMGTSCSLSDLWPDRVGVGAEHAEHSTERLGVASWGHEGDTLGNLPGGNTQSVRAWFEWDIGEPRAAPKEDWAAHRDMLIEVERAREAREAERRKDAELLAARKSKEDAREAARVAADKAEHDAILAILRAEARAAHDKEKGIERDPDGNPIERLGSQALYKRWEMWSVIALIVVVFGVLAWTGKLPWQKKESVNG